MSVNDRFRIFVASDLHGSDRCFRKVVRALRFYGADLGVIAGDFAPKDLVIIEKSGAAYRARAAGATVWSSVDDSLPAYRRRLADAGCLTVLTPDEALPFTGRETRQDWQHLFDAAFKTQLAQWRAFAESELGTENSIVCVPGNDDPEWVDDFIDAPPLVNLDRRPYTHAGAFQFVGVGGSNYTPWQTPREFSEQTLAERLSRLITTKTNGSLIAVTHVPPLNSGLDLAPRLRPDLSYELMMGQPVVAPVGSSAVRTFVEEVQPLVLISGHIHEARGQTKIGSTLCINPGSLYYSGVLWGCLIQIERERVVNVEFTEG